jgi:NTP pyrophosphatase (non-canonical NTP hydrolase)
VTTVGQPKPSSSPGSKERSELYALGQQALADSRRWFPKTAESIAFTALALGGEVGEVQNIVKKIERGSYQWGDAKVRFDLHMEVADVMTYLVLLAGQLNVDLVQLYNLKRIENEQRFGGNGVQ